MQILDDFLTGIANAIRKRKQTTAAIKAEDFITEIETIPQQITSVVQSNKNLTITTNGTTTLSPDSGYDALAKGTITTNVQPSLQSKSSSLTTSSATTIKPDSGYYGLSQVTVTPAVQTKSQTITSNGTTTIKPDSGKVGLSSVSVTTNVQPKLQSKSTTISSNTTTTIKPDSGYNGLSQVSVTTNVSNSLTYKIIYFQGNPNTTGSGSVSIPADKTQAILILHASTQGDLSPSASGTGLTISRLNTDALGSPYSTVNNGHRHSSYVYTITKAAGTARTLSVSCGGNEVRFSCAIVVY